MINLAARAGVRYSLKNPFIYASTNYIGSLNLLDFMRRYNIKKYIMASTSSIYAGSEMPFKESSSVNKPISPYAASKKAAELIAYTYSHQFNLDVTVLRYFTVYGPSGRPDMSVLRFIKWIDEGIPLVLYGDGSQSRDFTYIDDIVEGVVRVLDKPATPNPAYDASVPDPSTAAAPNTLTKPFEFSEGLVIPLLFRSSSEPLQFNPSTNLHPQTPLSM